MAKWERMWDSRDNQEVGLEAAILERKRNSSLVKPSCAEDVPGLKPCTEAVGIPLGCGSGAFRRLMKRHPRGVVEASEVRMLT